MQNSIKQRITPEQIDELSEKERVKLREMWQPDCGDFYYVLGKRKDNMDSRICLLDYYPNSSRMIPEDSPIKKETSGDFNKKDFLPLLSIGQMIELLVDGAKPIEMSRYVSYHDGGWTVRPFAKLPHKKYQAMEFCDALWEAIRKLLQQNNLPRKDGVLDEKI